MKKGCELCDSNESKRREDNIHVCNKCNEKYPIPKNKINLEENHGR